MQAVSWGLMLLSGAGMRNAPAGSTNCAIVREDQDIIFSWPLSATGFPFKLP
jgi:hypothetical protein